MSRVTIEPARLRDASFVCANLNHADRHETYAQVHPDLKTHQLAYWLLQSMEAHVAYWHGKPAMFFGVQPISVACLSVWALGTKQSWRCANRVASYMVHEVMPRVMAQGYTTMEARSFEGHWTAHNWIEKTGGRRHGEPFEYGREGERFILFRWTADRYHDTASKIRPFREPAQ